MFTASTRRIIFFSQHRSLALGVSAGTTRQSSQQRETTSLVGLTSCIKRLLCGKLILMLFFFFFRHQIWDVSGRLGGYREGKGGLLVSVDQYHNLLARGMGHARTGKSLLDATGATRWRTGA